MPRRPAPLESPLSGVPYELLGQEGRGSAGASGEGERVAVSPPPDIPLAAGFQPVAGRAADEEEDLGDFDSSFAWLQQTALSGNDSPRPPKRSSPRSAGIAIPDLDYIFQGYVVFEEDGLFCFGRRYGGALLDVHTYRVTTAPDAYLAFLRDKIAEGFVPMPDLTCAVPSIIEVQPLDLEEMREVFVQLAE